MSNGNPDISYDTFDKTKDYQRVTALQGKFPTDAEWNELQDIQRYNAWRLATTAVAPYTRIGNGFSIAETAANVNNFQINSGSAIANGTVVVGNGDTVLGDGTTVFIYDSSTNPRVNYISKGFVTAVDTTTKVLTDSNKYFTPEHALTNCRVIMTSGVSVGQSFQITGTYGSGWDENSFTLTSSGALNINVEDTYVIVPPLLTTPVLGTGMERTDIVYLQVWFEHINGEEDTDLILTPLPEAQTGREKLRWCVRVAEGNYDSATGVLTPGVLPSASAEDPTSGSSDFSNPFGVQYISLATLTRDNGVGAILVADINNYRGVELNQKIATQELVDGRGSEWFDAEDVNGNTINAYTSLAARLNALEGIVQRNKLFNGSFELGSKTDIEGWINMSNSWKINTSEQAHQSRCLHCDHTSVTSTRTEMILANPVRVRPNMKMKLSGMSKGKTLPVTVTANVSFYTKSEDLSDGLASDNDLAFTKVDGTWEAQDTYLITPSDAHYAVVYLVVSGLSGNSVYFDDIRLEFLEEAMDNTDNDFPQTDIFGGRFDEGMKCWRASHLYAEDGLVSIDTSDSDSKPVLEVQITGAQDSVEVSSWPVNMGLADCLDDVVVVKLKAKYRNQATGSATSGPYVSFQYFDSDFSPRPLSGDSKIYLNTLDWGNTPDQTANVSKIADSSDDGFDTYTILVTSPHESSFLQLSVGAEWNAGGAGGAGGAGPVDTKAWFKEIQIFRFNATANSLNNRTYNDLCLNGEFGRGILVDSIADENDPAQDEFVLNSWDRNNDSGVTGEIFHWETNRSDILAPRGDRVASIMVPDGEEFASDKDISLTQTVARILTEQDSIHGFVMDFWWKSDLAASITTGFNVTVRFLDARQEEIGTPTIVHLLGSTVDTDWAHKLIPIKVPDVGTTGTYRNRPVYLQIGFSVISPTVAGNKYSRISGVQLWGRTQLTPLNELSSEQYLATQGYTSHESVPKPSSFYETGYLTPASDNRFLLENDSDLLRKSVGHSHRHVPASTTGVAVPGQDDDHIPVASLTQTGLMSTTMFAMLESALQNSDLANFLQTRIYNGFGSLAGASGLDGVFYSGDTILPSGELCKVTGESIIDIPQHELGWNSGESKFTLIYATNTTSGSELKSVNSENKAHTSYSSAALDGSMPADYTMIGFASTAHSTAQHTAFEIYIAAPIEFLVNAENLGYKNVEDFAGSVASQTAYPVVDRYRVIDCYAPAYRVLLDRNTFSVKIEKIAAGQTQESTTEPYKTNGYSVELDTSDWDDVNTLDESTGWSTDLARYLVTHVGSTGHRSLLVTASPETTGARNLILRSNGGTDADRVNIYADSSGLWIVGNAKSVSGGWESYTTIFKSWAIRVTSSSSGLVSRVQYFNMTTQASTGTWTDSQWSILDRPTLSSSVNRRLHKTVSAAQAFVQASVAQSLFPTSGSFIMVSGVGYVAYPLDIPDNATVTGLSLSYKLTTNHADNGMVASWYEAENDAIDGSNNPAIKHKYGTSNDITSTFGASQAAGFYTEDILDTSVDSDIAQFDGSKDNYIFVLTAVETGETSTLGQLEITYVIEDII